MTLDGLLATLSSTTAAAARVVGLLVIASVLGDVVHTALHACARARWEFLRALAALHHAHHEYFDDHLRVHPGRFARSAVLHLIPEALVRAALCVLTGAVFGVDRVVVVAACIVIVVDLVVVIVRRGRDAWHAVRPPVPAPRGAIVVDGPYHALHHAFPDHFISAHVQVLDRVLGTMLPLARRRVLLTGSTCFVAALQEQLRNARADVFRVDVDTLADEAVACAAFADVDVLVLGHDARTRGPTSYEALIAVAAVAHGDRPLPLDVWAIGDGAAWRARAPLLMHDRVILRRLVHAPVLGARLTLALLRRGARTL